MSSPMTTKCSTSNNNRPPQGTDRNEAMPFQVIVDVKKSRLAALAREYKSSGPQRQAEIKAEYRTLHTELSMMGAK